MSYTMTLDMPQKEAMYIQRRPRLRRELNAIFVAVVASRMQSDEDTEKDCVVLREAGESVSDRLKSFVRTMPKLKGRPYRFRRADAYDEELA